MRVGQIWIIICKQNKNIGLFSETEIFQHNFPGLRYTCASGPEACGCRSGRSLLVASVATPNILYHFLIIARPRPTPLHWRMFALGREVKHPRLVRCHDRIPNKSPSCSYHNNKDCTTCSHVLVFIREQTRDPSGAHFQVLKVLLDDFHTPITDVQYSRQLTDSYSPVLLNKRIEAVTVLTCYGSPRPALTRFIPHGFPSLFKCTAPLTDTNIWQCLLTILPLQTWTDFRWYTTFFRQEFDYNALFHANVYLRFAYLPHNWQNRVAANTRSVNDLGTVLPHTTTFNGLHRIF